MAELEYPSTDSHKTGVTFGFGANFVIFPGENSSPGSDLQQLCFKTSLHESIYRKLINESAQVFLLLQKSAANLSPSDFLPSSELLRVSQQYRSILRDCQEQLDVGLENTEVQSELLYKLELLWNLVEIINIDKVTNGTILPQLLIWISHHFPLCFERAREIIDNVYDGAENHPHYWTTLTQFLLQGRIDQAQKLLRIHSDYTEGDGAFVSLDELIRKMPIYSNVGDEATNSAVDFEFRWKHWQAEVKLRIREGDFEEVPELGRISGLLGGSSVDLNEIHPQEVCETWYQWMVGSLLFINPTIKVTELAFHAQQAINSFGGINELTSFDVLILSAIEADIPQLMNELCDCLDSYWFPAHLLDLLSHTNHFRDESHKRLDFDQLYIESSLPPIKSIVNSLNGLREFLLLDYATTIAGHQSMWQTAIVYFDHCPTQGKQRTELVLERLSCLNEKRAEKIIALASERNITSVVFSVCKVMGMKALAKEHIGSAMAWSIRSQDSAFISYLADRLLAQYCEKRNFSSIDLLDNLGSLVVISERLTFLVKYREFHRLCSTKNFVAASNLLHSLLWSRLAPKYFWVTLLMDAIPFLGAGGGCGIQDINVDEDLRYFTSEQIYELLHCVEELCRDSTLPPKQRIMLEEHENKIRLGLAHNLALTLLDENDDSFGVPNPNRNEL